MTVSRTICLGFLTVISIGTLLLLLPISISDGHWGNFITALFTSTSAVCVTGLVVVDTGTYFSTLGQFFILLLIQVGGLGYMTATTFLLLLLGRRFGLREKMAIQQSLDQPGMSEGLPLIRSIIAVTMLIELTGTLFMFPIFASDYGPLRGLWLALFHSISAFNNAGFGLFPDNMISYATSVPINIIIPMLLILGGIGYQVLMEMYMWLRDRLARRRTRAVFSLNFKIVTSTTIALLVVGTIGIFLTEFRNPDTLAPFSFLDKWLVAWFQGVVPRTAGFNSVDYGKMTTAGLFITIALMFIGASPGSTGGGIKTTTLRVLFSCTKSALQGKDEVLCYQRQIPMDLIVKAIAVVFGSMSTVVLSATLIAIGDPTIDFISVLFEAVSAFATVGLSTGITAGVSGFSKLVLIATMYVGRVGVLLLVSALLGDPKPSVVRYPEEELLVG